MKTLVIFCSLFVLFSWEGHAETIQVQCRGAGASSDRFVYDAILNSSIGDVNGLLSLSADGRGPNNQFEIGNRFQGIQFASNLKRDERGRPLKVSLSGPLLPDKRAIEIILDLSRFNSRAELQFERTDGEMVFANLTCTTTLPQVCKTESKCSKHCHPMIG